MATKGAPLFGNILAPPWMGWTPVLPGIRDIERDIDLPLVTVPANSIVRGQPLAIDTDGDFLAREMQFVVFVTDGAVQPGAIRVRIRDGAGRLITTDFISILDLNGPMFPMLPLCKGSVLIIDYQNVGSTTATVWLLFKGYQRSQCADQSSFTPNYTPMYKRYSVPAAADIDDFEYPFTFTSTGAGDLLRIPLQTDNDADFLWRGLTGDWNTANNDVAVVGNVGLTFYDPQQVRLGQVGLTTPWNSPNAGLFRELVLPSGGGRVSPQWPEIFIPRGGVLLVDISFGAAETVRFSLRGVKLYGVCQ